MAKTPVNFDDLSVQELDEWHEKLMEAKGRKAIEHQNELIGQYQELRRQMIEAGVVNDDQLPSLKRRGWTRTVPGKTQN